MSFSFPRCQIIPLPDHQFSFRIDGKEKTKWHFGSQYPRPFFFPVIGPTSGESLTRMGHPGAPDHDHHRSVWFAHHVIDGESYWASSAKTQILQQQWMAISDADEEGVLATRLHWNNSNGVSVLQHDMIAAIIPGKAEGEWFLETQSTFLPAGNKPVDAAQSNFGFFAVRMAKSISAHFGGGEIVSSEGGRDEPEIFGQSARWMDYSGPMPGPERNEVMEGITLFDHPENPHYPAHWHVRRDGWMGPSACRHEAIKITKGKPLVLRYLLHIHKGAADEHRSERVAETFSTLPGFEFAEEKPSHQHYEVRRIKKA